MNYKILISILCVIVFLKIAFWSIKRWAYFQPSTKDRTYKSDIKYNDISYKHYYGREYTNNSSKNTILYLYGGMRNLTYKQSKVEELYKLGYSVVIFDYSGYGRTKGPYPDRYSRSKDSYNFMRYMLNNHDKDNIIIYSECISASQGIEIASRYKINRVIIESACTSILDIGVFYSVPIIRAFDWFFPEFNLYSTFQTLNEKNSFIPKILMIHSVTDNVIPFANAKLFKNQVDKFITASGSHNKPIVPWKKIDEWISCHEN